MTKARPLAAGVPVHHPRHGNGRVVVDMGATAIVRFGGTVEQVLASEIIELPSLYSALRTVARRSRPTQSSVRRDLPLGRSMTSGACFLAHACSCFLTSYGFAAK